MGVVASTRPWRSELQAHVRNHVSGVRLVVLREPRALEDEAFDVVVIDDVASMLSAFTIRRLRARGIAIVGVYDPAEDESGRRLLAELGVDVVVAADVGPEEFLDTVATLAPLAEAASGLAAVVDGPPAPAPADGGDAGVVAVCGACGEPAGVEVAAALAGVLAERGERVLLLDANEVSPAVARRLGYGLEPNLLTALDVLRHGAGAGSAPLAVRHPGVAGSVGFDTIVGLPSPGEWEQLRDADVEAVVAELAGTWDRVVAVVGPCSEELGTFGAQRFGATRTVLGVADVIVGVAPATRLGVLGWLDWAGATADLVGPNPLAAVLWGSVRSRFQREELEGALRANLASERLGGVWWLPTDPRVEEAAWSGRPVGRGPFRRAVTDVTAELLPAAPRRRRRRQTAAVPSAGSQVGEQTRC